MSVFARYAISYCEISAPPFDSGASHDSATSPLPAIACRFLGAVGAVIGIEGVAVTILEYSLHPTLFWALTAN